jgi:hypothetical protein
MFWRPSPVLILIAIIALPQVMRGGATTRRRRRTSSIAASRRRTRLEYRAAYLALTGFLGVMTYELREMLSHVHRHF